MRLFASVFVTGLAASAGLAQVSRGTVIEGITVESEILKREVRYSLYLPFDYETSQRSYPVVYLLHGYGDDDTGWIQFGEAHLRIDQAIASLEIPPMVVVMPDGENWRYINNYDNFVRYEDFFFEEFIPSIEASYRIRSGKRYRGVAGLSMGGYGSLIYSLRHPDAFAACAALSPGVHSPEGFAAMDDDRFNDSYSAVFGPDKGGENRLTEHMLSYNTINLVRSGDADIIKQVRFYIDCGDDDKAYEGNSKLHIALKDKGVPHEYRVRDGGHNWSYWRSGLIPGLKFIGESFHQP